MVLYKNEPKEMGKYTVTYVSDTTLRQTLIINLILKLLTKKQVRLKRILI